MNRLYDTVEPTVIDEELLRTCIEDQGPQGEAGRIAKREGTDFTEVRKIRLDFKNILKIDNLWFFNNLVKLNLDNNIIEKIENLGSLIHLEWLDLSFNNIEKIEGLDKLTKLRDLTLYNNHITTLENMESLNNLHVLSIGNNNIDSFENVIYLRRFENLRCLNVAGNPFTEENYKPYVVSHLPKLTYLDFRLVSQQMREEAIIQYQDAIDALEHNERDEKKKIEAQRMHQEEEKILREAFVDGLKNGVLFEELFAEDVDGFNLNQLPLMDEAFEGYKEKMTKVCNELVEFGIKEQEIRARETGLFEEAVNKAKQADKEMGVQRVNKFLEYKKEVLNEIVQLGDPRMVENKVQDLHEELSTLWDVLMGYELQLAEQLEDVIKDFERALADMISNFTESAQNYFTQCRELELLHHEKLTETALLIMEKVLKSELEEELPEDLRIMFVDKDTITNAVNASHDVHNQRIDNKEDDILTRINNMKEGYTSDLYNAEIQRNRNRIAEINHFLENTKDEIDEHLDR